MLTVLGEIKDGLAVTLDIGLLLRIVGDRIGLVITVRGVVVYRRVELAGAHRLR